MKSKSFEGTVPSFAISVWQNKADDKLPEPAKKKKKRRLSQVSLLFNKVTDRNFLGGKSANCHGGSSTVFYDTFESDDDVFIENYGVDTQVDVCQGSKSAKALSQIPRPQSTPIDCQTKNTAQNANFADKIVEDVLANEKGETCIRSSSCPPDQSCSYSSLSKKKILSEDLRKMVSFSMEITDIENESETRSPCNQNSGFKCSCPRLHGEEVVVRFIDIKPCKKNSSSHNVITNDGCFVEELGSSTITVCRHPNCMENNQERPYLLCNSCDKDIHSLAENGGHLVFDLASKKKSTETSNGLSSPVFPLSNANNNHTRQSSSASLPPEALRNTHSDNELEMGEDETDGGLYLKKAELDGRGNAFIARASKFRRKKVVKGRRHHTDLTHSSRRSSVATVSRCASVLDKRRHSMDDSDPYSPSQRRHSLNMGLELRMSTFDNTVIPLDTNKPPVVSKHPANQSSAVERSNSQLRRHSMCKVNINDELIVAHFPMEEGRQAQSEVIAAVRNSTLRDAIGPLLERRKVDIQCVQVFLDSSHTPLPWNCEIFLLGGKNLHVKDKDGESILSRVKGNGAPKSQSLKDPNRGFKSIGLYTKRAFPPKTLATHSVHSDSQPSHRKFSLPFRERLLQEIINEHPLARSCESLSPSTAVDSLDDTGGDSFILSVVPQSLSSSSDTSTRLSSSLSAEDVRNQSITPPAQLRKSSLPFRERLHHQEKNEHPMARNHISSDSVFASQRGRRSNNLSIDDTTLSNSVLPPTSPHGTWSSSSSNEKKTSRPQTKLQQLFNPPSKERGKQEQLTDILNGYSMNNLPMMPDLMRVPGQPVYAEEEFDMEAHWSSVVANASSLTKRQHDQQEAIWELLQTEVHYIKSLRVINELFNCVLLNLQEEVLLNEIETEKLFSNINNLYLANCQFWRSHMLTVLESARESRRPLDPSLMKEGFKKVSFMDCFEDFKFADNFKPYTKYCLEQKPCLDYMKSRYGDNELFKCFVVWAEAQKQCNRLKLTDLLVKPMQRLTKYSLLLQAVLKKTEDDKQRMAVLEMIGSVDRFVTHVNSELRKRHEQERLGAIISKIESYDAVEPPNEECKEMMQEYNTKLDLWRPMPGCNDKQQRILVLQSSLKMRDAQTRIDVECMLFTDLLLMCKASKRMDKFKIIKPPMRVDNIIIQVLKDKGSFLLVYVNEYRVPVSAFTFHSDPASVKIWLEHIKMAQGLYSEAKIASTLMGGSDVFFSNEAASTSPSSPNSFLGESRDNTTYVRQLSADASVSKDKLPAMRPRSFTVGQDPDDENGDDEPTEFVPVSQTLKREVRLNAEPIISPESSNSAESASPPPSPQGEINVNSADDIIVSTVSSTVSSSRQKLVHPSMTLPTSAAHPSGSDQEQASQDVLAQFESTEDEFAKMKLNQRRLSRTEKRYHTADSIQELERRDRDKDSSIHKRLSWNLGMVDLSIAEKNGSLKNKTFSSDSLRSVHSSSGVSSTGSLHLSPESEISEESTSNSLKAGPAIGISMNPGLECQECNIPEVNSDSRLDDVNAKSLSSEDKKSKSRSTSDISNLMSDVTKSQMKDGISSVELPRLGKNKKLSYSQMLLVKKQLLLSSDIEASEV